jgi:hypothetical protein
MVYSLFSGRHELPPHQGALCLDFNFSQFCANRTELWNQALDHLASGNPVGLYVTGLTPALTEFLSEARGCAGELTLFHYHRESGDYVAQVF